MTAFFFSALIQKEEGDRVEKTDGFSCDETAGKGIFNDGSGTDIILTGDNKASVYGFRNSNGMQVAVSISPEELETIEPDKIPEETLDKYELIDLEELDYAA